MAMPTPQQLCDEKAAFKHPVYGWAMYVFPCAHEPTTHVLLSSRADRPQKYKCVEVRKLVIACERIK